MINELTEDNLQEIVSSNDKVFVQFGASWCGACKVMKPRVKRASESNDEVVFVYVDVEENTTSREITTIKNLPTFIGFTNGELVSKEVGSKSEVIQKVLNKINK